MTHLRILAVIAAAAVGATTLAAGAAPQKGKQSDTPVTSTLFDTGAIGSSTNYRIQSDGWGSYLNLSTRRDSVKSILQTSNDCCQDWELSTTDSTTRQILVDFRDPVPPNTGATAPFAWAYVPGRILVQCHLIDSGSFPDMALGQQLDCPAVVTFPAAAKNTLWRISLGHAGQPGTDAVQVSCTGTDAFSQCNAWAVESLAQHGGELKNVGRLLKVAGSSIVSYGDYYLSFSMRVTRP